MPEIQCARFAIDETPHCVWDLDIRQLNLDFLNGIDPTYFEHIANIHGPCLEGDERQYAAIALRTAYSQGLETLFALLGATVQAPFCVAGWMLKYRTEELIRVVRKILERQPIYTKWRIKRMSFEKLAEAVNAHHVTQDAEKDGRTGERFGALWRRFATDFLDEKFNFEYNSIKHGLRLHMGGFYFAMGAEDTPGVACPPERMHVLASNEFGSSFFVAERLHDRRNHVVARQSLNWNPINYFLRLHLISMSISNTIGFLKVMNGVPATEVKFSRPINEIMFDEAWKVVAGMSSVSWGSPIKAEHVTPLSSEDILSVYTSEDETASETTGG
jgi:hypothetical protein